MADQYFPVRYVSEYNLYCFSINSADMTAVIKRKVPCGGSNDGTYIDLTNYVSFPWRIGVWQHFSATKTIRMALSL